ncbi:hypothetical protein HK102_010783, partial [Quaeritorhiza haematococci]
SGSLSEEATASRNRGAEWIANTTVASSDPKSLTSTTATESSIQRLDRRLSLAPSEDIQDLDDEEDVEADEMLLEEMVLIWTYMRKRAARTFEMQREVAEEHLVKGFERISAEKDVLHQLEMEFLREKYIMMNIDALEKQANLLRALREMKDRHDFRSQYESLIELMTNALSYMPIHNGVVSSP